MPLGKIKIDEEKTKEIFGYSSISLTYGSNKKVIIRCLNCGELTNRVYSAIKRKHRCKIRKTTTKRCCSCHKWKNFNKFNNAKHSYDGFDAECRNCRKKNPTLIKWRKKDNAKIRKSFDTGDLKLYFRKRECWLRGNSKFKNIKYDLDCEYLLEIWNKQDGKCYYTNLPIKNSIKQKGFQAWDSPSVDRLDPDKGYTKGNIVWCIFAVNAFKQRLNETEFKNKLKEIKWNL